MRQDQQKQMTEQIWRKLSARLRQFVRSRIDSAADVDDILQTVFLRIHLRFASLRKIDRLESWAFQITRNAVADYFRKKRDIHDDVELLVEDSDDCNTDNVNTELAGCLSMLIKKLPENQRRALSMYELKGVPQKDIATYESISVSGAKSRIRRGRKSLETILSTCCDLQFDRRGNVIEYEVIDAGFCEKGCA